MLPSPHLSLKKHILTAKSPFMEYSLPVFLTVLGAAVMHAGWNALVRGGSDPLLHTAAIIIWTGVIGVPFVIVLPMPNAESMVVMFYSVVVHLIYYFALASAYRHAALSVVYPIMRGSVPLMISLGAFLFMGESLAPDRWLGIALISIGVVGIALRSNLTHPRQTLTWALICSLTIAAFTIIDAHGSRLSGNALSFAAWLFFIESIVFVAVLIAIGKGRALYQYVGTHLKSTAVAGAMSATGYTIVLWAVTVAPIALVSATRETSVLFAAIIGVTLLREKLSIRQWISAFVIVAGLIALRL
jgi:drug/metabolite transporter (DMT)-like permease|uniref:EamA family transporter n=2 Tax=Orrella sp. TaxID=1921583 RepID=UPI00405575ED